MFKLGLKNKLKNFKSEVVIAYRNILLKPKLFNLQSDERIGVVFHEPSDMCLTDRVMLYALVRGLRPISALEIGSRWGGSAKIITNAMEENGVGKLIGIDPDIKAFRAKSLHLHNRFEFLEGYSPQSIPDAIKRLGNKSLDFVFIDGLHTYNAVLADLNGCLPYLSSGAHILLHDTYHQGIDRAVKQVISENYQLIDLGFITRNPNVHEPVAYQGLRLIRFGEVDSYKLISEAYLKAGSQPIFDNALRNYDQFANRIGKGATQEEIAAIDKIQQNRQPK